MAGFIYFTEEQKRRANEVNLESFLLRQGERLLKSGREKRLASDHSITVRGNQWYDHAIEKGGGAIDFVKMFYGKDFPDAVTMLLDGEQGEVCYSDICEKGKSREEGKPFALPEKNTEMRRAFAYLTTTRGISRTVLAEFIKRRMIYEDRKYHNAVFVGYDKSGVARHAHKHGTFTGGKAFKGNEENSYVALCGLSEQGLFQMLEDVPYIRQVALCLDRDRAGLQAEERIQKNLEGRGYREVFPLFPSGKDWNEDLQELMAKGRRENLQMQ